MKIFNKKYFLFIFLVGSLFANVKIFAAVAWTSTGTNTWSDGPVGIGTSSPNSSYKLDINGNMNAGNNSTYWSGYRSNGISGKFGFNQSDIFMSGIGGNLYSKGFSSNAMGIMNASTTFQDIFLYNKNGADAGYLVLKANNKVGINTINPLGSLGIDTADSTNWLSLRSPSDGSVYHINNAIDHLEIGTVDGTNGQTHWNVLKIIRNGDIYMGNNADTVNLSVNGAIKTKQILVTNTGWADYVFDSSYKLMPTKELESYIDKNKHLPNVPSASDIQKNGISIADMQKTQMEKIEELTLYVLDLQKQINELKLNK